MKVLRDFLTNKCGFYIPPPRDITPEFCKVYINYSFSNFILETSSWRKEGSQI